MESRFKPKIAKVFRERENKIALQSYTMETIRDPGPKNWNSKKKKRENQP